MGSSAVDRSEDPIIHRLKTWPDRFQEVWDGRKLFEIRKNDRDFRVGDWLYLQEWDPADQTYSGRRVRAAVSCIVYGPAWDIPPGLCVMGWTSATVRRDDHG